MSRVLFWRASVYWRGPGRRAHVPHVTELKASVDDVFVYCRACNSTRMKSCSAENIH